MAHKCTVVVGGVTTACLSRSDLIKLMIDDCSKFRRDRENCKLIFDLNGHGLALSLRDAAYRRSLAEADIVHADGQPVVFASRLFTNCPIPERSATTDLFHDASAAAANNDYRFYLLGASEEINERCAHNMARLYPGLQIVGRRDGYFSESVEPGLCKEINSLSVDVLWVGLGKPLEQEFCIRNRHRLKVGWVVTCGGAFNYVAGTYSRAPQWMQRAGLEWLYRVVTDPTKFSWRYLTTNPVAVYMLLTRTYAHDKKRFLRRRRLSSTSS